MSSGVDLESICLILTLPTMPVFLTGSTQTLYTHPNPHLHLHLYLHIIPSHPLKTVYLSFTSFSAEEASNFWHVKIGKLYILKFSSFSYSFTSTTRIGRATQE